jgi:hypothetical protein
VRRLSVFAIAATAAVLAGTAVAAAPRTHAMDVSLPDGSVAHVEYSGDVAPKVSVMPGRMASPADAWAMPFPSFASFDRMIEQMRRQSQEVMQRAQMMSRQPNGASPYIASFGGLPAAGSSTTIVSVSNNGVTCTRTTEVVSEGPGKAPKVTSNVSGQCGGAPAPAPSNGATHPA